MLLLTINSNQFIYLELNQCIWRPWPALFKIWFLLSSSQGQRSAHKRSLEHYHWMRRWMFISSPKTIRKPSRQTHPLWWDRCESTSTTLNPKNINLARLHGVRALLSLQTSPVDIFTVLSRSDGHCLLLPAVWNNWQLLSDNWRVLSLGASLSFILQNVGVHSAAPGVLNAARFIKDDMNDCGFI